MLQAMRLQAQSITDLREVPYAAMKAYTDAAGVSSTERGLVCTLQMGAGFTVKGNSICISILYDVTPQIRGKCYCFWFWHLKII